MRIALGLGTFWHLFLDNDYLAKLWCSGRDLNPQAFRHTPLKRTCLPVPPPERREGANLPQTATAGKCRVYSSCFARAHAGARNRNRNHGCRG